MREEASFAAGCFWGIEAKFAKIPGVLKTEVGYSGGSVENPSYELVCGGRTGHRETVHLEFDPDIISYEELLDHFWKMHDPTSLNRQGPDIGYQYGTVIFYHNEAQRKAAEHSKEAWETAHKPRKIMTEIIANAPFYRAEEYHQKYIEKKSNK